jgi:hypothetical protein
MFQPRSFPPEFSGKRVARTTGNAYSKGEVEKVFREISLEDRRSELWIPEPMKKVFSRVLLSCDATPGGV